MIEKRIHVRVEHVRPNRARELHRERVRKNEEIKKQARISHIRVPIKRLVRLSYFYDVLSNRLRVIIYRQYSVSTYCTRTYSV